MPAGAWGRRRHQRRPELFETTNQQLSQQLVTAHEFPQSKCITTSIVLRMQCRTFHCNKNVIHSIQMLVNDQIYVNYREKRAFPGLASGDTRATCACVLLLYERVAAPWATPVSRCCICEKLEMYRFLAKFGKTWRTWQIFFDTEIFFWWNFVWIFVSFTTLSSYFIGSKTPYTIFKIFPEPLKLWIFGVFGQLFFFSGQPKS